MDREIWTLLAIASADKPITPAQLQKSIFLAQKKFPGAEGISDYKFVPYNYGPFDKLVYTDAEALVEKGLVAFVPGGGGRWRDYNLTTEGREYISNLGATLDSEAKAYLSAVVEWAQKLSFNELVAAIYQAFPEMKINSVFRE